MVTIDKTSIDIIDVAFMTATGQAGSKGPLVLSYRCAAVHSARLAHASDRLTTISEDLEIKLILNRTERAAIEPYAKKSHAGT